MSNRNDEFNTGTEHPDQAYYDDLIKRAKGTGINTDMLRPEAFRNAQDDTSPAGYSRVGRSAREGDPVDEERPYSGNFVREQYEAWRKHQDVHPSPRSGGKDR